MSLSVPYLRMKVVHNIKIHYPFSLLSLLIRTENTPLLLTYLAAIYKNFLLMCFADMNHNNETIKTLITWKNLVEGNLNSISHPHWMISLDFRVVLNSTLSEVNFFHSNAIKQESSPKFTKQIWFCWINFEIYMQLWKEIFLSDVITLWSHVL